MNNYEINLKAAKIAGLPTQERRNKGVPYVDVCDYNGMSTHYPKPFDIFNSADDREAVMIALGEKHTIQIDHTHPVFSQQGWWYFEDCMRRHEGKVWPTYIEAVVDAVKRVEI